LNRKLDLRSGRPVWLSYRAPSVTTKPLSRDIRTDVLIVGLGISGAMIAEALAAEGRQVIGIDRRGPIEGSTTATTALVQFEIDQPLRHLSRQIGREQAIRAWQRSRLALTNLRDRLVELDIRCDWADRPSLYLAGNVLSAGDLDAERRLRNAAGLRTGYLTHSKLKDKFGIARDGALLTHGNLELDPRKLTAGLLRCAQMSGAKFHRDVEICVINSSRDEVTVSTSSGATLTCRYLILATGYEKLNIVPQEKHKIVSTWAIATKPQPRSIWRQAALVWEASNPYLYARATKDGRVICGGEDEDLLDEEHRDALIAKKAGILSSKLGTLFPTIDAAPVFAWTGFFGATNTGLPYIGRLPQHRRIFGVMGYGGNGITYAQLASELILSELEGTQDVDAELFAFGK